jgi:signal transduction histidine kinase
MYCYLFEAPKYLIYYSNFRELEGYTLLYYSHIPTAIVTLLVGVFLLMNAKKSLPARLLFLISVFFSIWIFLSLLAWTNINVDFLLFIWPFFGVSQAFISILSIYFIYTLVEKKDISFEIKSIFTLLLLPVLLFAHTNLSVGGFNITDCDAFGYEGLLYKIYYTALGILAMIWIATILLKKYQTADNDLKKQIILIGLGIEFFLLSFFMTTFIVTYLAGIGVLPDSGYEMYGLFGMTVFMTLISVSVVKFKTFNVGITTSTTLVVALLLITASKYTFSTSFVDSVLTTISLVLMCIAGYILIRSVRNEIKQKEKLQVLTTKLEKANVRLKALGQQKSEFVSIASHQLRSPLTAIRGYASLLLEGSFGTIPQKAQEPLERIDESSKLMAFAIEDYLNVSRIESGNMKYNLTDFNLPTEVEHITDDLRADVLKKGLVLYFKKNLNSQGIVSADIGKTVQIIHNLINNAIKYTPEGTIEVLVRDDINKKKIFVDIMDSGIGMDQEALDNIFQKFERAKNANSVNSSGTGLGLFVADKMAEAMGGDITAHSEGDGKGSRFTLEMPLAM